MALNISKINVCDTGLVSHVLCLCKVCRNKETLSWFHPQILPMSAGAVALLLSEGENLRTTTIKTVLLPIVDLWEPVVLGKQYREQYGEVLCDL